jgi:hypothetical protein
MTSNLSARSRWEIVHLWFRCFAGLDETWHILSEDDIVDGIDELGVLPTVAVKQSFEYAPRSRDTRLPGCAS